MDQLLNKEKKTKNEEEKKYDIINTYRPQSILPINKRGKENYNIRIRMFEAIRNKSFAVMFIIPIVHNEKCR